MKFRYIVLTAALTASPLEGLQDSNFEIEAKYMQTGFVLVNNAGQTWKYNDGATSLTNGRTVILQLRRGRNFYERRTGNWSAIEDAYSMQVYYSTESAEIFTNDIPDSTAAYSWLFYKQEDGTYKIFNELNRPTDSPWFIGYEGNSDSVLMIPSAYDDAMKWSIQEPDQSMIIEQGSTFPCCGRIDADIGSPYFWQLGDSPVPPDDNFEVIAKYPHGFQISDSAGNVWKVDDSSSVNLQSGTDITLVLDRTHNTYSNNRNWCVLLDINSKLFLRHSGYVLWENSGPDFGNYDFAWMFIKQASIII